MVVFTEETAARLLREIDTLHAGETLEAVRRSRVRDPWTQGRLAKEAGLNQSHLSKLERGKVQTSVSMWVHLLRVMGVMSVEIRPQSGEFLVDGRELRPVERVGGERIGEPYLSLWARSECGCGPVGVEDGD